MVWYYVFNFIEMEKYSMYAIVFGFFCSLSWRFTYAAVCVSKVG